MLGMIYNEHLVITDRFHRTGRKNHDKTLIYKPLYSGHFLHHMNSHLKIYLSIVNTLKL